MEPSNPGPHMSPARNLTRAPLPPIYNRPPAGALWIAAALVAALAALAAAL